MRPVQPFLASMRDYEASLQARFGEAFEPGDLDLKHAHMRESAFLFLRATCWRWAEAAPDLCPDLMGAPEVSSVGDAHAGNFGLWRDEEARLVWGVNDYDEAAIIPYALDLVRLCASALLGFEDDAHQAASAVLKGYERGLEEPQPFVLERRHLWLRDAFAASDAEREEFWRKLEAAPAAANDEAYRAPLLRAIGAVEDLRIVHRSAGVGSLGRPRFVAFGSRGGGPIAREIKGAAASCFKEGWRPGIAQQLSRGPHRSPDPMLTYTEAYVLRRLAPNSRKLNFDKLRAKQGESLLAAMGAELASVHAADAGAVTAIKADLGARKPSWLANATTRVADWTRQEFSKFRN